MYFSTVLAAIENKVIVNGNQDGATYIPAFISRIISVIVVVAGIAFFFMFIIGALQWILAGGDKAQTENARARITQALTGLVILFSAWAVAKVVESVFGVNILNIDLTPLFA